MIWQNYFISTVSYLVVYMLCTNQSNASDMPLYKQLGEEVCNVNIIRLMS